MFITAHQNNAFFCLKAPSDVRDLHRPSFFCRHRRRRWRQRRRRDPIEQNKNQSEGKGSNIKLMPTLAPQKRKTPVGHRCRNEQTTLQQRDCSFILGALCAVRLPGKIICFRFSATLTTTSAVQPGRTAGCLFCTWSLEEGRFGDLANRFGLCLT